MAFINETGIIATILASGTASVTGNMVASLLVILLFIVVVAMMFGIPLEFTSILIIPICLVMGAYYSNFIVPLTIIFIYITAIISKNWLIR